MIKSRRMRGLENVACIGEIRDAYKILVGKLEDQRPLGISKNWWEDNIKTDLGEKKCGCIEWIHVTQVGTRRGLL
jgi:hypothetical protein